MMNQTEFGGDEVQTSEVFSLKGVTHNILILLATNGNRMYEVFLPKGVN